MTEIRGAGSEIHITGAEGALYEYLVQLPIFPISSYAHNGETLQFNGSHVIARDGSNFLVPATTIREVKRLGLIPPKESK